MSAIFHLAMRDLKKHWWIMVVLIGLFSLLFGAYITLLSHYKSTIQTYTNVIQNFLVVGNSDGLGEIHGSRMTPAIKEMLLDMGYTDPIPEIHQIVGTNFANGTLLKGIRLEDYQKYNSYSLLKGRSLVAGDPPRLAMIGEILANTQDLQIDNDILLRGRKFKVIGIFKTGSVQDNEAWISLEDAQALLNYDRDVSLYLIPDNGQLKAGDLLTDDVLVSQRGETGGFVNSSIRNYLNNYAALGILSGIATIITLANILYRLAQLRRREFGILKSIGFGFNGLAAYFFTQAGILVISGLAGGILFAIFIVKTMMTSLSVFGFGVSVGIDLSVLSSITLIVAGFFFICAFIPLIGIYRESIPELVGRCAALGLPIMVEPLPYHHDPQTGAAKLTLLPLETGEQKIKLEGRAELGLQNSFEQVVQVESVAELQFAVRDEADPIEIGAESLPASLASTGFTLAISSADETGAAPGRVDSPPTSITRAPSSTMANARSAARPGSRYIPPSLKLSGVTLRMPMTSGPAERSRVPDGRRIVFGGARADATSRSTAPPSSARPKGWLASFAGRAAMRARSATM